MDRGAWQASVYGVPKSRIRLKRLSTHALCWESQGRKMKVEKKLLDSCPDIDRSQNHASLLILVVGKT